MVQIKILNNFATVYFNGCRNTATDFFPPLSSLRKTASKQYLSICGSEKKFLSSEDLCGVGYIYHRGHASYELLERRE